MSDILELEQIGLNGAQRSIYLNLLEMQEATVSELAKRSRLNRSSLYGILDALCEKGITTYIIKNNIRYYRATEPHKLLDIMNERTTTLTQILPQLLARQSRATTRPIIEILEGREGIKTILNDVLRLKKPWIAYNAPGKGPTILGPTVDLFEKERIKKKISLHVIAIKNKESISRAKSFEKMPYTTVKYTPTVNESPASNWIYGDRLCIIFWYKEYPFAIRIIDKKLAESYRNYFWDTWNRL